MNNYQRYQQVQQHLTQKDLVTKREYFWMVEEFRKQSYHGLNDNNIKYIQKPVGNEQLVQIVNET